MASNVGDNLMLPDEVVDLASGGDRTSDASSGDTGWTEVDISSHTGSQTAKAAVLRLWARVYGGPAGEETDLTLKVREKGTTPTNPRELRAIDDNASWVFVERTVVVPVDDNEKFDYRKDTDVTGASAGHRQEWGVELEGWYV